MTNDVDSDTATVQEYLRDDALTHAGWCEALADGILLGQRCEDCDTVTATPKAACIQCGSLSSRAETLPTTGEIYAETEIAVSPAGFSGEYAVALVDLGETRLMARLDGPGTVDDHVALAGTIDDDEYPGPLFTVDE